MTLFLIILLAVLPFVALATYAYAREGGLEDLREFLGMMTSFMKRSNIGAHLPWAMGTGSRHRIQIQGPKERCLVCQICLGRIKPGLDYALCDCGKVFHPACLSRTGFCPYCSREYGEEDLNLVRGEGGGDSCPVCGAHLPDGATGCGCGAIFVSENGEYECPTCGTVMREGEWTCPGCGEVYERCEVCPLCGSIIPEGEAICQCGLVPTDVCPECGCPLAPDELICPSCGAQFELVE